MFRVEYKVFLLFSRLKVGKRRWKRLRRASRPFHALKDKVDEVWGWRRIFKKSEHPKGARTPQRFKG